MYRKDAIAVRTLSGLSGAEVVLMRQGERFWFVRKQSTSVEGNHRLRRQAEKQSAFAQCEGIGLLTPAILGDGETDGRYYFDMEFVRGFDGASFLRRATYPEVTRFADHLCRYLVSAADRPALFPQPGVRLFDALYRKLCEVQRRTRGLPPETLARLFLALERVDELRELPTTCCHGDLTLENLVVTEDGRVWAFDLLDSPFEHYWQDLAKLHQDLEGGWYRRKQPAVAQCVLSFVSRRLSATARRLHPAYPAVHHLLLAATFVRILPYARTAAETELVAERIRQCAERAGREAEKV